VRNVPCSRAHGALHSASSKRRPGHRRFVTRARHANSQPSPPNDPPRRAFTALAADATSLGKLLRRAQRISLEDDGAVDLGDGAEREILAATLRAGAAQHLRAGEDLLTLVERLNRMMEVSSGRHDGTGRAQLGMALLRGIAVTELLDTESRERFPASLPLAALARDAAHALAQGYLRALGAEMPADLRRAFPRFALAVRDLAGDVERRRPVVQPPRVPRDVPSRAMQERMDAPSIG
jgi:hypothetical protein